MYSTENYLEHCYGVLVQGQAPIVIKFRAFWPQNAYLKNVPIHESQGGVQETDGYTEYTICGGPTYNVKQEFMGASEKVAVLAPEEIQEDMIAVLEATLEGYRKGENHSIDE